MKGVVEPPSGTSDDFLHEQKKTDPMARGAVAVVCNLYYAQQNHQHS